MMMDKILKKTIALLVLCLCCCTMSAQKTKRVTGFYRLVMPKNMTEEQAYQTVLQRAKENAIESAFGQDITRSNIIRTESHNGESKTDFSSLGQSLLKGEWVETIGEPDIHKSIDEESGQIVFTCTIKGRVREYKTARIEFDWNILCNGTDIKKFKSKEFNSGDRLYVSFQTPKDGYVAIYLIDAEDNAICLLPDADDSDGQEPVKHGQEYVFFSSKAKAEDDFISSMFDQEKPIQLYTEEEAEINKIKIIFSPNPFTKPVDREIPGVGRGLSLRQFEKWLGECRRLDSQMAVDEKDISITK